MQFHSIMCFIMEKNKRIDTHLYVKYTQLRTRAGVIKQKLNWYVPERVRFSLVK